MNDLEMTDSVPTLNPVPGLAPPRTVGALPNIGNMPNVRHLNAAKEEMKLSPQEEALYMRHLKNVGGEGGVDNENGSRSTLFAMTAEVDGKHYVIPTVWDGKIVPPKAAMRMAEMEGLDKFPSYGSAEEADARYQKMHDYMEKDMAQSVESAFAKGFEEGR